jgi:CHAT domain-containing protein
VVHLATHGFSLTGLCASPEPPSLRGIAGIVDDDASSPGEKVAPPAEETTPDAISLSGLALAGANLRELRHADSDDGILTAEEIAGMDLSSVEWAVLSGCDTGMGEIRSREGVLGLRRAFRTAGARTVIASLWPVEDGSTREWMKALYTERLLRQRDTADSVRGASLAALSRLRAQHASTHPFFWAGFVAIGDWR